MRTLNRFPVMRIPTRKILAEIHTTAAVAARINATETRIYHGRAAPLRMRRNMTMGAVSGKRDNPTTRGAWGVVMIGKIITRSG
jgi:hypothetical protein